MSRIDIAEHRAALRWLASGDTGMSSRAILYAALQIAREDGHGNECPFDPDDLGRCLRLLRRLPWARRGLDRLARRCPVWKRLRAHWVELAKSMDGEVGIDWSKGRIARGTYDRMKAVLGDAA